MKRFNVKVRLPHAAYQGTVVAESFRAAVLIIHDQFANQNFVMTVFPSGDPR